MLCEAEIQGTFEGRESDRLTASTVGETVTPCGRSSSRTPSGQSISDSRSMLQWNLFLTLTCRLKGPGASYFLPYFRPRDQSSIEINIILSAGITTRLGIAINQLPVGLFEPLPEFQLISELYFVDGLPEQCVNEVSAAIGNPRLTDAQEIHDQSLGSLSPLAGSSSHPGRAF